MSTLQTTLVLVKPDGVARSLVGEVITRLERKKLKLLDIRMLTMDRELAGRHYAEHAEKPFFGQLVDFISSGPVVAIAVHGEEAISVVRQLMGATDPKEAAPGTVRGDYALELSQNIVHGSDSPESASLELALFFPGLISSAGPQGASQDP